ncbi:MAG TPA: YbhB/YbcL family Raf kinase inhibitor-like protein [bacterium]|nr:YbhB/YbcL family Raf kinase inhibitor-like protein [bacterium]
MELTISSFRHGEPIPDDYAFCNPAEEGYVTMGANKNPHLQWSNIPEGTQSLGLICVDPDAPSARDDVNEEGRTVPKELPRTDFYHWVLVDISPEITEIPEGAVCDGVTPGGKETGQTKYGIRGLNNYTEWFAEDEDMAGEYGGYDGPCPPWNDERVHRYYFRLYALDVPSLNLTSDVTGPKVVQAMEGHILGQAEWMGTYTLNKQLR